MIKIQTTPTEKEKWLVQMVADEKTMEEIAEEKKWSPRTAGTYVENIRKKYQCRSRVGLVVLFYRNKLIS